VFGFHLEVHHRATDVFAVRYAMIPECWLVADRAFSPFEWLLGWLLDVFGFHLFGFFTRLKSRHV
jgi:hypothetical protein